MVGGFLCRALLLIPHLQGYANGVIGTVVTLIKRKYGAERVKAHNFGTVLNSLAFAGTIVGMLSFGMFLFHCFQYALHTRSGYLSDKVGRKFGMMTATGIVALFSFLSATIHGVNGSLPSMLAQLAAWR